MRGNTLKVEGAHSNPARKAADRALSALYRENIGRLRAYLTRILKSQADAEDVAQESFLRLCNCHNLERFRQLRAVLFKTAYRLALNRLRQRKSNPLDRADQLPADAERVAIAESAEEALIAREQEIAYNYALESLSPRRRQVIELRTVHELSYREMSDTLGLSISTLEKHLAKGKSDCTAVLSAWWQDGAFAARHRAHAFAEAA